MPASFWQASIVTDNKCADLESLSAGVFGMMIAPSGVHVLTQAADSPTGPFFCNLKWADPDYYSVGLIGECDKDSNNPSAGTVSVLESVIGNGAQFACNHYGELAHLAVPWGRCSGGDGLSAAVGHGANFQCINGNGNIPGYRGTSWGNVGLHDCSTMIAYLNALWPQPTPAPTAAPIDKQYGAFEFG